MNLLLSTSDRDRKDAKRSAFEKSRQNSFLARSMRASNRPIYYLLVFLISCSTQWYRKLPEKEFLQNYNFQGKWVKITNPRSAINSSWHKNNWTEQILITEKSFSKEYFSTDKIGGKIVQTRILGKGNLESKGNWLLLKTKTIDTEIKSGESILEKSSINTENTLLYYFNKELGYLFPMIYDTAYREQSFGVKDGVNEAYNEEEKNFLLYMKIYAFKEYQPHIYQFENMN